MKGFEVYGKESLSSAIYMRFSVRLTENVELMRQVFNVESGFGP